MFEEFLNYGSILSVLLMVYAGNVMIEALRRERIDPFGPGIIKHPLSALFMFASIPCQIWPAIYVGLYSGWLAGVVAWFVLQMAGAFVTIALGIRGPALVFHFVLGCIAFPIGYYLSISTLPV